MIRKLRLSNWRAYESAVIPFDDGTTFVVAPNGIGKTSLIEAAQYALAGDASLLDTPVQLGADLAEVELTLQLPLARVLRVARTLYADPGKEPTFVALDGDNEIDEPEFRRRVEEAFGASVDFVAHNAFLRDRLRDLPGLDLRALLARAFGLEEKRSDARQLFGLLGGFEGEASQLSKAIRAEKKELSRLEAELVAANDGLTAATARLDTVRAALDAASAARDQFNEYTAAVVLVAQWDEAYGELNAEAQPLIGKVKPGQLAEAVEAAATEADAAVSEMQSRAATLQARITMIDSALAELLEAGADCPVCRRPLDEHDKDAAEAEHRAESDRLRAELDTLDLAGASARASDIRGLLRQVDRLGPRPDDPTPAVAPDADPEQGYLKARADLERGVSELDSAQARVRELEATVQNAREAEERTAQSVTAWRKWALTSTAATALSSAIDDALSGGIEPIASDVRDRWNALFADRPDLRFDLEGDPWREVRGHRLDIGAFSSGEKTAARLLMQLAILTTATDLQFCWVDEPLEHLDPQTRRLVAGMLSNGREALGLRQMVVTTYEEQLAQHLEDADRNGMTRVEYIRAGPASALSSN